MKSIIQPEPDDFNPRQCYLCGRKTMLQKHHVFPGVANRKISEANGFWCDLCVDCHLDPETGAQYNNEVANQLKADCQMAYEETHTREEWMKLIGKNYLPRKGEENAKPVSERLDNVF